MRPNQPHFEQVLDRWGLMDMVLKVGKLHFPRSLKKFKHPLFALFLLFFTSLGCVLDDLNPAETPTITPVPQTGTDFLRYYVPNYEVTLVPGQSVPGTGVRYVDRTGTDYNLTVDSAPLPNTGDTVIYWEGIIRPGVFSRYNLQISPVSDSDNLKAVGPVNLSIFRANPTELAGIPQEAINGAVYYSGMRIGETATVGQTIPGTSLKYDGQRNGAASFTGTLQTNLRPLNSSFIWYGKLLDGVFVKHTLRVNDVTAESVSVGGTTELWVIPNR